MRKLNNTQRKNIVNKSFGVVQAVVGLGIPAEMGPLRFDTFNVQYNQKRQRKGPKRFFVAEWSKALLMKLDILPKGAMGKFSVGKISKTKEEIDSMLKMLKTR
jgi:hypothetical protein